MLKPFILGVSGGSGSGKTTFAHRLQEKLGPDNCSVMAQDSYYIDQSHLFDGDGGAVNFDHPDAIDFNLMAEHIIALKNGDSIEVPRYDFKTHRRLKETTTLRPTPIIVVDGILLLSQKKVRELFDASVFVQVPEQLRFQRRLRRDVEQRGRTPEGVKKQFELQVKPMHDQFVEASSKYSTHLIDSLESFDRTLDEMVKKLRKII